MIHVLYTRLKDKRQVQGLFKAPVTCDYIESCVEIISYSPLGIFVSTVCRELYHFHRYEIY